MINLHLPKNMKELTRAVLRKSFEEGQQNIEYAHYLLSISLNDNDCREIIKKMIETKEMKGILWEIWTADGSIPNLDIAKKHPKIFFMDIWNKYIQFHFLEFVYEFENH